MAFDKTMFFLMAMYENPIVPVSKLRKDFFQNLSLSEFVRKLKAGDIAMPMIEMGGDEFSPYGIHVQDVAKYIDTLRAEGRAAYERGWLSEPAEASRKAGQGL